MKNSKYIIFLMFFVVGFFGELFSQSGWQTGNWYAYQGESTIQTTIKNEYNVYCQCYVPVKYCRRLNWYQEWHSGYIYYWQYNPVIGRYQWVSEWKEGYFWYCTWSGWYTCY